MSEPVSPPDQALAPSADGHWVKVAPPSRTTRLPHALLAVSALWGTLALVEMWLGPGWGINPHPGSDLGLGSPIGWTTATLDMLRSSGGGLAFVLTSTLILEAHAAAGYRGREPRFNPAMAFFCWIIPVANLWLPKLVVDDVWAACASPDTDPRPRRRVIAAWWPLWLVSFIGSFALNAREDGWPTGPLDVWDWLRVLVTLCAVAAYVAWWRVVRGLNAAARPDPTRNPRAI